MNRKPSDFIASSLYQRITAVSQRITKNFHLKKSVDSFLFSDFYAVFRFLCLLAVFGWFSGLDVFPPAVVSQPPLWGVGWWWWLVWDFCLEVVFVVFRGFCGFRGVFVFGGGFGVDWLRWLGFLGVDCLCCENYSNSIIYSSLRSVNNIGHSTSKR